MRARWEHRADEMRYLPFRAELVVLVVVEVVVVVVVVVVDDMTMSSSWFLSSSSSFSWSGSSDQVRFKSKSSRRTFDVGVAILC
jgi:hypothetical protein